MARPPPTHVTSSSEPSSLYKMRCSPGAGRQHGRALCPGISQSRVLFCFKEKGLKLNIHLFILPSKNIKKGKRHKKKTTSCHHHLMKAF